MTKERTAGSADIPATGIEKGAERLYLLRLGAEVTTKSRRTRNHFQRRLASNLRDALDRLDAPAEVERDWSRIWVRSPSDEVKAVLPHVFGISSISPIDARIPAELDAIVEAGKRLYSPRVAGKRYAVRARRSGRHAFSSRDIHVELGAALNPGAEVDLDRPDIRIEVEVRGREAFLFTERIPGAGGLPVGVEGRALALISGGYDSAVAAALLLGRGVELDYVFCNLGGEAYERAVVQVTKVLADEWSYGTRPRLYAVDFSEVVESLRAQVNPAHVQIVLKRLMYRAASLVARGTGAEALVTGEALGQVSSQTLKNLRAIEPASELPVFRPLIGFGKQEVIGRARAIGTAELSAKVREYCAIGEGRPATGATIEAVDREEAKLDLGMLEEAVREARVHDLRALTPMDLVEPYLFIDEVPEEAVLFDCRSEEEYARWHAPGAEHRDPWELLEGFAKLDRDSTYVMYCQEGTRTAYLAERMQRAGYEAYSFRGGLRGIARHLEATPGRA